MRKLWTRNRKFQSTSAFIQIYRLKVYLTFMMICDILHEHSAEYLVCRNVVSGCSSELLSMQWAPKRLDIRDMLRSLASPAGFPAAFPPDAADFANILGMDRLCTQNVKQNLQCGSSALENPPGDMSKMQIFYGMSLEML